MINVERQSWANASTHDASACKLPEYLLSVSTNDLEGNICDVFDKTVFM